jgi:hypothetical protein
MTFSKVRALASFPSFDFIEGMLEMKSIITSEIY